MQRWIDDVCTQIQIISVIWSNILLNLIFFCVITFICWQNMRSYLLKNFTEITPSAVHEELTTLHWGDQNMKLKKKIEKKKDLCFLWHELLLVSWKAIIKSTWILILLIPYWILMLCVNYKILLKKATKSEKKGFLESQIF